MADVVVHGFETSLVRTIRKHRRRHHHHRRYLGS